MLFTKTFKYIRKKLIPFLTITAIIFSGISKPAAAKDFRNLPLNNDIIMVFLDFSFHQQFIRETITFVNFVRDKDLSQVHIMMTFHNGGSGGNNYVISFLGRERFEGMNNVITYWDPGTNTVDETRRGIVRMISIGLTPYLANTKLVAEMEVSINNNLSVQRAQVEDPWNNWIFEIYGGAFFDKESSKSRFDSRWGFSADKISEDWKIKIRPFFNLNGRTFKTDEGDITSLSKRHGFNGFIIKSINQHWSAGLFVNMLSSTFHNIKFNIEASPGIEYSLFPYTEASRKAVTLVYRLGVGHYKYIEETLFFKEEENLANHALDLSARLQQPWGSFMANISGSHYFHDFKANRLSLSSNLNVRIIKGLSLSLNGDFNFINDLVALPAGDLSLEDILLQQSRQATNYQASASVGISYSFGSQFSNVVNTRF